MSTSKSALLYLSKTIVIVSKINLFILKIHCLYFLQGLNRIAAIALLFLSEEDAFWCLVAITEHLMPADYYTITLAAAQADQVYLLSWSYL